MKNTLRIQGLSAEQKVEEKAAPETKAKPVKLEKKTKDEEPKKKFDQPTKKVEQDKPDQRTKAEPKKEDELAKSKMLEQPDVKSTTSVSSTRHKSKKQNLEEREAAFVTLIAQSEKVILSFKGREDEICRDVKKRFQSDNKKRIQNLKKEYRGVVRDLEELIRKDVTNLETKPNQENSLALISTCRLADGIDDLIFWSNLSREDKVPEGSFKICPNLEVADSYYNNIAKGAKPPKVYKAKKKAKVHKQKAKAVPVDIVASTLSVAKAQPGPETKKTFEQLISESKDALAFVKGRGDEMGKRIKRFATKNKMKRTHEFNKLVKREYHNKIADFEKFLNEELEKQTNKPDSGNALLLLTNCNRYKNGIDDLITWSSLSKGKEPKGGFKTYNNRKEADKYLGAFLRPTNPTAND